MQTTDFEAEFIRRTGKRPDQCSADELQAEIVKLQAEGEAHLKHGDELRAFGEGRRAEQTSNDNAPSGDAA